MKRLAMGLMLTSLLLVAAAFSVGAVPLYEDPNVLWTSTEDGTTGYLLVVNMDEGVSYNTLILESYTPVSLVDDACLIYSGGAVVVQGLTDYLGQLNNNFYRINLPVAVGYLDFVILKLTADYDQSIRLYQATFANY
jgi:hypothetical protein